WRRGQQRDSVRRVEIVPDPLRHDDDHPRGQLQGLRAVRGHQAHRRGAVDDLHQFVAALMALPWSATREFGGEDAAVAILGELRERPFPFGFSRRRRSPLQHLELGELVLDILDSDHASRSTSLWIEVTAWSDADA